MLVEALELLNNSDVPCNLAFIGGDLGDNIVEKLAKEKKLINKILFYGPCYEEEKLGELIYNASVCVSPGPIGLTAIHSLTYGTPAISNDDFYNQMPEHEVIQEGKTGTFYKDSDFPDLCDKIKTWVNISNIEREVSRQHCYGIIEDKWNPSYQLDVLRKITNS
jgi:glycosyltransferase involved in cell wall biosynthesis